MKGPDSIEENLEVSRELVGREAFKNPWATWAPDSIGVIWCHLCVLPSLLSLSMVIFLVSVAVMRLRLRHWADLCQRCWSIGVLPLEVPADGNCMVWSLQVLQRGPKIEDTFFQGPRANRKQRQMRRTLSNLWQAAASDITWQAIFKFFVLEEDVESESEDEQMRTTPQREKAAPAHPPDSSPGMNDMLKTPPKPAVHRHDGKRRRLDVVEGAKPVPFVARANPPSPNLRKRGHNELTGKKRAVYQSLDPGVPDLEEANHMAKQMLPRSTPADDMSVDEVGLNEISEADLIKAKEGERKRARHSRAVKSRQPTPLELRHKRLARWLAGKGATYAAFAAKHRFAPKCKKSFVCKDGGFSAFKTNLIRAQDPTCEVCQKFAETCGIKTFEARDFFYSSLVEPEPVPALHEPEEPEAAKDDAPDDEDEEDPDAEYKRVVEYVESKAPVIKLLPGFPLKYQCLVCKTQNQPTGKINKLGDPPTLKAARYFLQQHLETPTHIGNVRKFELSNNTQTVETHCPGYCVSSEQKFGVLAKYHAEFRLWVQYSKLDSKIVKHTYWCDRTTDTWYVRHFQCAKRMQQGPCCDQCLSAASTRGVVKLVIRFLSKYYAATLLQQRLFCTDDDLAATVAEISQSPFGQYHVTLWDRIRNFKVEELQDFVRSAFNFGTSVAGDTEPMKLFLAKVVEPCLKINVNTADETLTRLSAQFVPALTSKRLNAT